MVKITRWLRGMKADGENGGNTLGKGVKAVIWGIYLAAGQSRRMGCSKLALPVDARPLGSMALETAVASALDGVAVVTRDDDSLEWITPGLFNEPFRSKWIHAPCRASLQGQSESIKCGLRAVHKLQAEAVMILLADQPFVSVQMINRIVSLYRSGYRSEKPKFVTAFYAGIARPPVLFDSGLFSELLQLQGDEGARRLIRGDLSSPGQGLSVEYTEVRPFIDIDTPEDYQKLLDIQRTAGWKITK